MMSVVAMAWSIFFGFFLGFAFGVGCALAVMYGIYLGGYRAALRDLDAPSPSRRLLEEQARLRRRSSKAFLP